MEQNPIDSCDLVCLNLPHAESLRALLPPSDRMEGAASGARALADPTRLTIAMALWHGTELCVCDMAWVVGQAQGLVSYHLRQLKSAGLVSSRRQRQLVLYRLTERGRALTEVVVGATTVTGDKEPDHV
ncbi:ArsR/SmtB family transcription factor [Mycobacterium kubicae]|uniref:ArsR/SmtB family transcription factor n=1 Tax=Mycobacterium kubicae TaxID=120959 RepID=UPI0007FDFF97|nr:metalloregulator ArsR/SmtB family transcription factor [Mycobacterium kubicae]OBK48992.1 transcriptional regulator [Mycobacterium kubicae]